MMCICKLIRNRSPFARTVPLRGCIGSAGAPSEVRTAVRCSMLLEWAHSVAPPPPSSLRPAHRIFHERTRRTYLWALCVRASAIVLSIILESTANDGRAGITNTRIGRIASQHSIATQTTTTTTATATAAAIQIARIPIPHRVLARPTKRRRRPAGRTTAAATQNRRRTDCGRGGAELKCTVAHRNGGM